MTQKNETVQMNAGQLLGMSSGYWKSFALQAGVQLGVFDVIAAGASTGEEVAAALDGDPRGVTTLLDALTALGLLAKEDDRYANTAGGIELLTSSSPRYLGHLIKHHANIARAWIGLEAAALTGKPVRRSVTERSDEERASFLLGMHTQAMGIAPRAAAEIDLGGRGRLLDLGGGPGTWAIHFALNNPGLRATVFDLPGSRPFAEQTIASFDLADRVEFVAGDFNADDLPGGHDAIWLSHILHGEGPPACREIIGKAAGALEPGGLILIHEFILEDDMTRPVFPALFSLNMLVGTGAGRSYSRGQLTRMLEAVGVREIRVLPFRGPTESSILVGVV